MFVFTDHDAAITTGLVCVISALDVTDGHEVSAIIRSIPRVEKAAALRYNLLGI